MFANRLGLFFLFFFYCGFAVCVMYISCVWTGERPRQQRIEKKMKKKRPLYVLICMYCMYCVNMSISKYCKNAQKKKLKCFTTENIMGMLCFFFSFFISFFFYYYILCFSRLFQSDFIQLCISVQSDCKNKIKRK